MDIPNTHINREYVLNFLKSESVATLSMINKDGKPDAASIYYLVEENLNIFFITKDSTPKYENIKHQNDIVLLVTNPLKKETLKMRGKAFLLDGDFGSIAKVTDGLAKKLKPENQAEMVFPLLKLSGGKVTAVKIEPSEIHMSIYHEEGVEQETIRLS